MITEPGIEEYLSSLRGQLSGMSLSEREEIVAEIAAHIRDSAEESGADAAMVLKRLGPVEELAAQYRGGMLIRRASRSISPIVLLRGALRLATKGISGIVVFFVGVFGYAMGGGFVLSGLLKPVFPQHTGVWVRDGRIVSSGTIIPPPPLPAHEVLGMWYIPLALVIGSLTLLLTTYLIRTSLRLSQRWQAQFRRLSPRTTAQARG